MSSISLYNPTIHGMIMKCKLCKRKVIKNTQECYEEGYVHNSCNNEFLEREKNHLCVFCGGTLDLTLPSIYNCHPSCHDKKNYVGYDKIALKHL